MLSIESRIAEELGVAEAQVRATVALLDEGATVPFIARYRKEVTGALDDSQLRTLDERLRYLRELEDRRAAILKSIDEQDKLTPALTLQINQADTKSRLEDLYLPYKPKRRTKGQIAIEAGLQPLAEKLLADPTLQPEAEAESYLNPEQGIDDSKAALDGAKFILMEHFAEDADLIGKLRELLWDDGIIQARMIEGKENEGAKFRDYFEHDEALKKVPSHRALAMFRGRNEGVLRLTMTLADLDTDTGVTNNAAHPCESLIAQQFEVKNQGRAADRWLQEVVRWTWKIKVFTRLEMDLLGKIRESAEAGAIQVFADNLKDLLLAAPAGPKATMGLDPGLRTGVKIAIVDATGKLLDHGAIFPHAPRNQWDKSIAQLAKWCQQHNVELLSIGNGTASRETDKLAAELMTRHPELTLKKIVVNEAGASIYSASEFASKEFPDLDVTIRGAVSIARRLQDPLAELVKIEPKAIGVGQYQHDVSQYQLAKSLDAVVEDCVNAVGVDVNTASAPLLTQVSGLNTTIANNIVAFRDTNGAFRNRQQLKEVSRLGGKTFEQAAGFLRVMNGDNPLDSSAVHPESYSVVEKVVAITGKPVTSLVGDSAFLRTLKPQDYTDERFGVPTITDILAELDKPGRDPRPEFKMAAFQDGVESIKDLEPGMVLEGSVTNVTNFGAFVDIGVHQDGLVHISVLSDKFIKDPRDIVKAGAIVKVKVMEVDIARKRIALSMRLADEPGKASEDRRPVNNNERKSRNANNQTKKNNKASKKGQQNGSAKPNNAFADAFAKAQSRR